MGGGLHRAGFALALSASTIFGCGGGDETASSGSCEPGVSDSCVCATGEDGAQLCADDGTYEECVCGAEPTTDPDPTMDDPMMGDPMMSDPMMGDPMMGDPMMGDPPLGFTTGTCADDPPPGAPQAPDPKPYSGGTCPALTPGATLNTIDSNGLTREFLLVVPEDPQPDESYPVIFLWHWLNASAQSFYDRGDVQSAVNEQRFIAVIPNGIGGGGSGPFNDLVSNWPWLVGAERERDLILFDDLLSCVSEQFPVNKNCVSSAGVSDGALWTSQLAGGRGEYLSSIIVLSGGTNVNIVIGQVEMWSPSLHKMPAIVLWGGPTDVCVTLQFDPASIDLETNLTADGHFLIECKHDCGHAEPPLDVPAGSSTRFAALWDFVFDHPYWLDDGASPYDTTGLPAGFPDWCDIGMGSAIPRNEGGAGCDGPGCNDLLGNLGI